MKNSLPKSFNHLKNIFLYKYFELIIEIPSNPYKILFRPQPCQILFVLSHMRSGSTLLTHILASNPEIIGNGETHFSYESEADFKKLIFHSYWNNPVKPLNINHKYILDKVLHNQYFLNDQFLNSENVSAIYLLRAPQRTLESILNIKSHFTEKDALDYYKERLSCLEQYAKKINNPEQSLFITYEEILHQTNSFLPRIQKFLGTKAEFFEEYEVLSTTGRRGFGDSSENIKAGKILRQTQSVSQSISQATIAEGMKSFEQCHQILSEYCSTID